jgi:hypothetical protein
MKITEVGRIIAERILHGQIGSSPCEVVIKLGMPVQDEGAANCWYCPYSITTPKSERLFYGAGFDSVQAIRIALSNIGAELTNRYADLRLEWDGSGDLGFDIAPKITNTEPSV